MKLYKFVFLYSSPNFIYVSVCLVHHTTSFQYKILAKKKWQRAYAFMMKYVSKSLKNTMSASEYVVTYPLWGIEPNYELMMHICLSIFLLKLIFIHKSLTNTWWYFSVSQMYVYQEALSVCTHSLILYLILSLYHSHCTPDIWSGAI